MKKEFHILTNNSKIKCAKEKNISVWHSLKYEVLFNKS